eukprot:SAG11_NODE_1487_length_4818_cov_37.715194_5_plen_217_part_00
MDQLKAQYLELYGCRARGRLSNDVVWLQSRINEKLKDRRVGPRGPRGPKGAKGADGKDGQDGEDGEDGLSFLLAVQQNPKSYAEARPMRRGLSRLEAKLVALGVGANSKASNLLTQAIAVSNKLSKLNRELSGVGGQIQAMEQRYAAAKADFKMTHKVLQAEAVLPDAKQFVAVQLKKQDITMQRDMSALIKAEQDLQNTMGASAYFEMMGQLVSA